MHYEIHVERDAEAEVWYIEDSSVPGLVGETPILDALLALLQARVPEVLAENGCSADDAIPLQLRMTSRLGELRGVA